MGHLYRAYMSHHARFSRSTTYSVEGIFILTATLSSVHECELEGILLLRMVLSGYFSI